MNVDMSCSVRRLFAIGSESALVCLDSILLRRKDLFRLKTLITVLPDNRMAVGQERTTG